MPLKALFHGSNLARLIAALLSAAAIIMQGATIAIANTVTIDFGIGYFLPAIAAPAYSLLYSTTLLLLAHKTLPNLHPLATSLIADALGVLSNLALASFALVLATYSEFGMYPCAAGASPESRRWCGEARAAVGLMYTSYVVMIFVGIMHLGHWFQALGRVLERKHDRVEHGKVVELQPPNQGAV